MVRGRAVSANEAAPSRTYTYRQRWAYWGGYLPVALGLVFVGVVLSNYDLRPLSSTAFQSFLAVFVLDVVVAALLRMRSPRAFKIQGEDLLISWRDRETTVPLDRVSISRGLAWLLNFGTVLRADGKKIAVFKDLTGFDELLSICRASGQKHLPGSQ